MELANTTETFDDRLKKFVAEKLEREKWLEQSHVEFWKIFGIIWLVVLGIVILIATPFILHYVWLYWKSRRVGLVTRDPKTPIDETNLTEYESFKKDRDWRCLVDQASKGWNMCEGKVKKILKMVFQLPRHGARIDVYTRIVRIKMNEFKFGEKSHDFEPADGVISGSHFTYQMFGDDTIQVTRYVVERKSYVAGFCIYIKNVSVKDIEINMNVIKKLMKEAKYPGKEAVEKELKEELEKMKAGKGNVPSKFGFKFFKWITQSSVIKKGQDDEPPSYSSLSVA